jgi:hypothetical protein
MGEHWTLEDIAWERFDAGRVEPGILAAVEAAALVEHNSGDYVTYLCNVFHDDAEFQEAARHWGVEEVQHGQALARWAALADPAYDFEDRFGRFRDGYRLPLEAVESVRGSRAGELVARCVVEVGTSSFYSAIRDATDEPVLKDICHRIAGDEFRHYKLFLKHLRRYRKTEPLNLLGRLRIAFGRIVETSDDELAFAYYCGSGEPGAYDRRQCAHAYEARTYPLYRFGHIARGLAMVLKAVGLKPQGRLHGLLTPVAWQVMRARTRHLERLYA